MSQQQPIQKTCQRCGSVFFSVATYKTVCYPCYTRDDSRPVVREARALQTYVRLLADSFTAARAENVRLRREIQRLHQQQNTSSTSSSNTSTSTRATARKLVRLIHPDRARGYAAMDEERLAGVLTSIFTTVQEMFPSVEKKDSQW